MQATLWMSGCVWCVYMRWVFISRWHFRFTLQSWIYVVIGVLIFKHCFCFMPHSSFWRLNTDFQFLILLGSLSHTHKRPRPLNLLRCSLVADTWKFRQYFNIYRFYVTELQLRAETWNGSRQSKSPGLEHNSQPLTYAWKKVCQLNWNIR